MPATATSLTVTGLTLTATDNTAVTGYMITSTASAPAAGADGWSATAPTSVTFGAAGAQTAYAWARDAAGNVSASRSATVTITVSTTAARQVNGVVTDPVSGTPLGGATVSAFVQLGQLVAKSVAATAIATATTNADGSYTITGLTSGVTYYFEISATGFATFTYYNINPDASNILTLENARVLPSNIAGQTATASGTVKNASTNAGLPGMTVKIRLGVNNTTGTVRATATTDATGAYSFASLAAGTYTAEVTGNITDATGTHPIITSYFTLVSFPGTTLNTNQDFPVTSGTVAGSYRIVLNWGNDPRDLDSHLTGPTATSGTRFHTAYYAHDYPSGSAVFSSGSYTPGATTEAVLDVDNTQHGTDNGPETTTIVVPRAGTYNFFVHHYSGTSNISASGAQVKVYKGSVLLATYNPPSGGTTSGDVWAVFSMAVTSSGETITPVNRIVASPGTSTSALDGLVSGSTGTFTNKLTIGSGFDGTDITGVGTSFSLASLSGGTLYAHMESASPFGTKFARLYIDLSQKDYCTTCSSQPLVNGTNLKVGAFNITNAGTYTLKAYAVETVVDIGVETLLGQTTVTVQ
jgi:hypothetical protein